MIEWMDIINPHQYSERGIMDGLDDSYNDAHCAYEDGFVAGQRKLLKYLICNCYEIQTGYPELGNIEKFAWVFFRDSLEAMLKQLEKNENNT